MSYSLHMTELLPWIAVIDDEQSVRRALLRLLRSVGISGRAFESGAEFLNSIQTCRPSCVLLDLHMPGIDGFEVQSRLAQRAHDIPVIVMTGQDSSETYRRAMLCRPLAYLLKPIDGQTLLEAIQQGLQQGIAVIQKGAM